MADTTATCCAVAERPDLARIEAALRRGPPDESHADLTGLSLADLRVHRVHMLIGYVDPAWLDRPRVPKGGVVYFIKEVVRDGFIKIGKTRNLEERLRELQTANPRPLVVVGYEPGYTRTEERLHWTFERHRVPHSEWFFPADEIFRYIESINAFAKEFGVPIRPGSYEDPDGWERRFLSNDRDRSLYLLGKLDYPDRPAGGSV